MVDRPPCPHCQETALIIGASAHLMGVATLVALPTLLPGDQGQGWDRRWRDIEAEATNLLKPLTTPMTGPAIQAARQRLLDFYVLAYHLKDDLKSSSGITGVSKQAVGKTVSNDPDLALLADLAGSVIAWLAAQIDHPAQRSQARWPRASTAVGRRLGRALHGWKLI